MSTTDVGYETPGMVTMHFDSQHDLFVRTTISRMC